MTDLRKAAQAVIDRWDSPLWKNGTTAAAIADLRAALEQQAEPVADEWAKLLHYPDCWDTAAYPTLHDAVHEALAWSGCSVCKPEQQAEPVQEPVEGKTLLKAFLAAAKEAGVTHLQQAEPVGEVDAIGLNETDFHVTFTRPMPLGTKLYTAPPQRKPHRTVTYVCPACAFSLERQE
jgi:hypothetical protein